MMRPNWNYFTVSIVNFEDDLHHGACSYRGQYGPKLRDEPRRGWEAM